MGFDENGYPTEPYTEVVPGLFQADTTYSPLQLFGLGFGAVFDLCGIDRGDGVTDQTTSCTRSTTFRGSQTPWRSTAWPRRLRPWCATTPRWRSTACRG
jgi:hypothetical protein